ncbi:hypothetical protein C8035_v002727 [Colletotrichum spinosum]|uniref:Uncharacterized protein n=1 Tax=Colletotrichum spinosum TaxID=1347390 RepID=A0A4R8PXE0_9PEZI|nr:hypothetical protein C8035_v002727 [Colletotrichum spinosum]
MMGDIRKMLSGPMNNSNKILTNCKPYRKLMELNRCARNIPESIVWAIAIRQVALSQLDNIYGSVDSIINSQEHRHLVPIKEFLQGLMRLIQGVGGIGQPRTPPADAEVNKMYSNVSKASNFIIQSPRAKERGTVNVESRPQTTSHPRINTSQTNQEDNRYSDAAVTLSDDASLYEESSVDETSCEKSEEEHQESDEEFEVSVQQSSSTIPNSNKERSTGSVVCNQPNMVTESDRHRSIEEARKRSREEARRREDSSRQPNSRPFKERGCLSRCDQAIILSIPILSAS